MVKYIPMLNQEVIGPHVEGMYIVSDVNSAISNASMDSFANYYNLAFDNLFLIQKIKMQVPLIEKISLRD